MSGNERRHSWLTQAGRCGKSFHGVNTFAWLCQVRWLSPYHGSWTHSTAVLHITTTASSPAWELVQYNVFQNLKTFRFYVVNVQMSTAEYKYAARRRNKLNWRSFFPKALMMELAYISIRPINRLILGHFEIIGIKFQWTMHNS